MAKLNLPDIIYSLIGFPTLFIQFAWNGALALPANNILGFAPTGEPTDKYWVEVVTDYGGGTHPYLIVESRTGDLFNYDFSTPGVIMQPTGVIADKAIPYAKTSFVVTDLCAASDGDASYITITAANSLSCYVTPNGDLNFASAIERISLTLEFSVIQDMVIADLDGDKIDDLMVASFSGHVWVIRSSPPVPPALQLSGDSLLVEHISGSIKKEGSSPVVILGLGTSAFTGILTILKKKKKLPF